MAVDDVDDPIAIVGMAIEAPGGVDTAEEYWKLLSEQREALSPFPTDRGWAVRDLLDGSRRDGFKQIHDLGGFLCNAGTFDSILLRDLPTRGHRDGSPAARRTANRVARIGEHRHQPRRPVRSRCRLLCGRLGHRLRTGHDGILQPQRAFDYRHRPGRDLRAHRLLARFGRPGAHHRLVVRLGAGRLPCRCAVGAGRGLRHGVGRRGVRDGRTRLLRRVLQAACAVRRRTLPTVQRTRQRHGMGRRCGDVRPAAQVCSAARRTPSARRGAR